MKIEFVVYGKPQGKQRPRFSRRSNSVYTPKNTQAYERQIAKAYRAAANGLSFGDKPVEAVFDGLNGVAYNDDKQILTAVIHKTFCKFDGEEPRLLVTVMESKGNE